MEGRTGREVWKFPIPVDTAEFGRDPFELEAPGGICPVHVGLQDGVTTLWGEVNTYDPVCWTRFQWRGTGHQIGDGFVYVGTVIDDPFVWHLYLVP